MDFNFGFVQASSIGSRKNDDRIDLLSKFGYRIDSSNKWYASGLLNFRSQLFDGYNYSGGTSNFSFIPASTAVPAANSTRTSILLAGTNTFIGYGSLQKEYEILSISATAMYLRVQGTETGNAWYLKLKAL